MSRIVTLSDPVVDSDLARRSINTLRFLAVDAVQKANSGHPGMPMGTAAMAYVLWRHHITLDPDAPDWINRDRFILSAGHGSMLLYGLLHLTGYPVSLEDIKQFRQWESRTPGHPEYRHTPGVETTTGPLGQGFANSVGMAIAEKKLADRFNEEDFILVDHHTYVIVSDGDLMEGISHEAASLAGHLGLGKLIVLYDDNRITIDGSTDIAFTEDVRGRFEAYRWHVQDVADGNDVGAVHSALLDAKAESGRPSLIRVRTHIGYGSPNKQDSSSSHGSPLGDDEVRLTKENLEWPLDELFLVPDDVANHMRGIGTEGAEQHRKWEATFSEWRDSHPADASEWDEWMSVLPPEGWDADVPVFEHGTSIATRSAGGKMINALASRLPNIIGGSADLAGSNNTWIQGSEDLQRNRFSGVNIQFGIREHAMAAICNGMMLHGGLRPYCGTFLVFSDYMRPAIRLSALMELPIVYVFTHDSIGLGEDGPTHQPVEHLVALRAIPGAVLIRPSDGNETVEAWRVAMERKSGPVLLALSRQKLINIDRQRFHSAAGLSNGGYVLFDVSASFSLILIASGSEVPLALESALELQRLGVSCRVVSMPSWELFEEQSVDYRASVLPPEVRARISIEAGITLGWERYVGTGGRMIGIDAFGASAPADVLFRRYGFTVKHVVEEALSLLQESQEPTR